MDELGKLKKKCKQLLEEYSIKNQNSIITYTSWKDTTNEKTKQDWVSFKERFLEEQKSIGFTWKRIQGWNEPIELIHINLNGAIGRQLAKLAYRDDIQRGYFFKVILMRYIPELFDTLSEYYLYLNLDYNDVKEEFQSTQIEGKVYQFTDNSEERFQLTTADSTNTMVDNGRKAKYELSELIANSDISRAFFRSLGLLHYEQVQTDRRAKASVNADLQGLGIQRTANEDYFQMYNFILLTEEDISELTTAISQVTKYKERVNFTYLIIPQSDYEAVNETNRFTSFIDLCKKNQIGIISVRMNIESNVIEDIFEVLPAERTEVVDYSDLKKMVEGQGYEKCVICKRIVKDEHRENCGWRIIYKDKEGKEQNGCMKEKWGETVISSVEAMEHTK